MSRHSVDVQAPDAGPGYEQRRGRIHGIEADTATLHRERAVPDGTRRQAGAELIERDGFEGNVESIERSEASHVRHAVQGDGSATGIELSRQLKVAQATDTAHTARDLPDQLEIRL